LDDGKIYRKPLYLMVKTMVSCRFSLKPIHWRCHATSAMSPWWCLLQDVLAFFAQHDVVDRISDAPKAVNILQRSNGRPSGGGSAGTWHVWPGVVGSNTSTGYGGLEHGWITLW
jgi:hypothetical protein